MAHDLEAPPGHEPDWDDLYIARGAEVVAHRPLFTGDVFTGVPVQAPRQDAKIRAVLVLEHPCTMRIDGVTLSSSILVAKVRNFPILPRPDWNTNGKVMPLPALMPQIDSGKRNQAAFFDETYHVHPEDLELSKRIACLSEIGTYLLWQRWVYHSTRVIAPTFNFEEMNSPVFAEVDLVESWCERAVEHGVEVTTAAVDAAAWLDQPIGNRTRRKMLRESSLRSSVIREARKELQRRYEPTAAVIPLPPLGTENP